MTTNNETDTREPDGSASLQRLGRLDDDKPKVGLTQDDKDEARIIADEVIYHIDIMYPEMWNGVAKSARTSVRNTVIAKVEGLIRQLKPTVEVSRRADNQGGES